MLRYFLALLILAASLTPAAALAQAGAADAANAVNTATTSTTTVSNTSTTTNSAGTTDTADGDAADGNAADGNAADGNAADGNAADGAGDAAKPEVNRTALDASGEALLKLFVLAVILESALALLFNWRPFVARYDGRGVKAPISLAAALFLVFVFEPDAIAALMDGYDADTKQSGKFFARLIEAMVIAGGSAGVNRLLVALGFRSVTRAQEVVPKPKRDEAWISVGLDRQSAVGPVHVLLTVEDEQPAIAGTIAGTRAVKRSYFRRDIGRFPQAGGLAVPAHKKIKVQLIDQENRPSKEWGPCRFRPGAIVDLDMTL